LNVVSLYRFVLEYRTPGSLSKEAWHKPSSPEAAGVGLTVTIQTPIIAANARWIPQSLWAERIRAVQRRAVHLAEAAGLLVVMTMFACLRLDWASTLRGFIGRTTGPRLGVSGTKDNEPIAIRADARGQLHEGARGRFRHAAHLALCPRSILGLGKRTGENVERDGGGVAGLIQAVQMKLNSGSSPQQ
jgi:hypothetical protein